MNKNNNEKSNTLAYKIGQALAIIASFCFAAIVVALTIKFVLWIL